MNGIDLLDTARTVLREQLLDALPPEHRITALMIANAMAIARRELISGAAPQRAQLDSLEALIGGAHRQAPQPAQDADEVDRTADQTADRTNKTHETIERLNRMLCAEIRAGHVDPGTPLHERAYAHLRSVQRTRVLISNPRYPGVVDRTGLPSNET